MGTGFVAPRDAAKPVAGKERRCLAPHRAADD